MKLNKAVAFVATLVVSLIAIPLSLWFWGASHVGPLFGGEFTQHLGSIEVSYIQMAHFIEASLPHFAWQPRWYMGYPMAVLYTPLVPVFEYVMHQISGWSYPHAYRFLTAFTYAGGIVALYYLGRALFRNTVAGLVSALAYGTLPSVISLLFEEVAADRFLNDLIEPRRFTILVRWGEGPHLVSLLFVPLAALFFLRYLRYGGKWSLATGTFVTALVVLTNSVGAWGLALMAAAIILGEIAEHYQLRLQIIKKTVLFGAFAYGLAAFWFNPLFLTTFFREGGTAASYWRDQFPWGWLIVAAVGGGYFFLAQKALARVQGLTAAVFFFGVCFWLVYTYYASGDQRIELIPQVLRLTTEVDMGVALLVGGVVALIGRFLTRINYWVYLVGMTGVALGVIALLWGRQTAYMNLLPQWSVPLEETQASLETRPEYETAQILKKKVAPDERVFVPGNYAFYLNYFTDIPQLRGALFQSAVHPWAEHIYYQMVTGKNADIALAWLKIANIGWVVYSDNGRDTFVDFKSGRDKFDECCEVNEEYKGDIFYKVPLKDNSLAKAVPRSIQKVAPPVNAIDKIPILEYASLIEASPNKLSMRETDNGAYRISGTVDEDELILVQKTFVAGWKAKDGKGKSLEVRKDPLGFILIKPTPGPQELELRFTPTWKVWSGWLISLGTVSSLAYFLFLRKIQLVTKSETDVLTPNTADEEEG